MRLATAQTPVCQDPRQNAPALRALMQRAHDEGARLVHFPEGAMSGYPPAGPQHGDALRQELELTAALAGKLKLWTVLGSHHPLTPPLRPHNSLYVISDSGELAGRYDKRLCSYNEVHNHYTPGRDPLVFEVDGFCFGCALCIEVNFPELFLEYGRLGIDCLLFSSYSADPIFGIMAQGHAAANNYWLSFSVPAHYAGALPAGIIAPNGYWLAQARQEAVADIALATLDRAAPEFDIALNKARPWRKIVREGSLHEAHRVEDARSKCKTAF